MEFAVYVIVGMGLALWVFLNQRKSTNAIKKINNVNQDVNKWLAGKGFIKSRSIFVGQYETFFVDDINKKWFVLNLDGSESTIYNYNDIIGYEVYEDGNCILQSRSGRAAVGGLLFGTTGAIIGASGQRNMVNTCRVLQVRISVNNLVQSEQVIKIIQEPTTKQSIVYTAAIEKAKEIVSVLNYIKNQK